MVKNNYKIYFTLIETDRKKIEKQILRKSIHRSSLSEGPYFYVEFRTLPKAVQAFMKLARCNKSVFDCVLTKIDK